jgi:autotransporter-associated beta strand protein
LRIQSSLRGQRRLCRRAPLLLAGALLAVAGLLSAGAVHAQSFTWGGAGSTTTTTDYNLGTNWSNPPVGAPPVAAGGAAIFSTTGSTTVAVTAGPIAPNSWTFNANSQSYAISGAAVNFSQAGASGGIINNANSGQTISIGNNIGESVAGVQLQQLGNSTLVLTGTNTYSGGTTISAGTLQLGNGGSTGSITGDVVDNGRLVFARSDVSDFSGAISGSGSVTIQNAPFAGFTILTANNTYTGGTTITSGVLSVGNGGTTGSILGDVLNNGELNFDRSDNVTFSGLITGNGSLYKFGAGVLTLTADNTYSNATVIGAGSLQLGNGGTTGNIGSSTVNDGGTLVFNRSNLLTFGATISGTGNVVQSGTGTTVLSGGNSYEGGTTITAGTLQVTSGISVGAGDVTLNGGRFQADGLGNLTFGVRFNVGAAGGTVDNNGVRLTLLGRIADSSGSPGVLQLTDSSGGFGTTVLSGANTYSGGTTVVGAAVQVTNSSPGTSSSVGTGTVTLQDAEFQAGAASLTFSNNFKINNTPFGSAIDANGYALTVSGNITDGNGPGGLSIIDSFGGGKVVFTGANTYSGVTFICSCATLQLGTLAHTGSIIGAIENEGVFNIVNANTAGITSITTDGGFTTFFGSNTAGTATIVNKNVGVTAFFDQSSAGNSNITNRSGGVTLFGRPGHTGTPTAGNATIDNNDGGTIFNARSNAGTANITNRNGGGTLFGDSASAASAIIVNNNGGFTAFGQAFGTDTPTAGNATITNNAGGETDFNAFANGGNATVITNSGGATYFYDNSTGGNAQFITNGTGFVDFSGSLGPNGDGRIAAGSIAGSGFYYIGAGNTLVVGGNNLSTTVSGVITDVNPCGCGSPGPGNLEKTGAGTLILSGVNTYTGTTVVNGGVLQVDGSIAASSLTTVNAGGALTGAGTVGYTTIGNGGIFLPGNGMPGSFTTVAGNLALQSGALYLVQLNSVTSTFAAVTGTAALDGTVGVSFAPGSIVRKQYMILNASGGVSGGFVGAGVLGGPGGLVATPSYDPTHAYLNFALNFGAIPGINTNQQNVGNTLTNFFNTNGGIPAAFATLSGAGLSQVSGETATGTQQATFNAMNLFLGLLTDPTVDGRGGFGAPGGATPFAEEGDDASAYAAKKKNATSDAFARIPTKASVARNDLMDPHWSVWGSAFGGGSNTDGNAAAGTNSATARAFGFAAGADYRISPATLAGFALAGGGTNFSVNGFGSGRSDLFQAGAFVRHTNGAAYVTGALAYGWQDVTTDRTVTAAGVDRLHAEFNANAYSGRLEGGYRYVTAWMGLTPYAAGQFTTFGLPAYAEQVLSGAGTFALNYAARDVTASRTELGVRTDRSFALPNAVLTLRGRLAWAHDFNTDRNITAVFQSLPGAAFVVGGAAQSHDSALTTASAEMKWLNGWSAAATFEGEFSDVTTAYAGKGVVRYNW